MGVEGVLLAGGQSRRMGVEKGSIVVGGVSMAEHVAVELQKVCARITVLGGEPLPNFQHQPDPEPRAGPLAALAAFAPLEELVFVASCDLPLFRAQVVPAFASAIGEAEVVFPVLDGRAQPICALYRSSVFASIRSSYANGNRAITQAFEGVKAVFLDGPALAALGLDPRWVTGANTPEELDSLLRGAPE